ncbi:MAG: cupin domain-containing protein [Ignavibacteria bacterium]|nr:cupin domain-containing protein [Ignavibacteria bacterium]
MKIPYKLTEAVEYSDGSVVSKTILKKPSGTVTLFAFDKGEELSEHTASFDALIFLTDGEARITIGGEQHNVSTGEIIELPANVPHAVKATEKFKMMLIMLKD